MIQISYSNLVDLVTYIVGCHGVVQLGGPVSSNYRVVAPRWGLLYFHDKTTKVFSKILKIWDAVCTCYRFPYELAIRNQVFKKSKIGMFPD